MKMGYMLDDAHGWWLCERLIREAVAVANGDGMGFDAEEIVDEIRRLLVTSHEGYTSIYADLRDGRRTEVDTISGAVVSASHRNGVPAPSHEFIVPSGARHGGPRRLRGLTDVCLRAGRPACHRFTTSKGENPYDPVYELNGLRVVDLTKQLDPSTETRRCHLYRFNTGGPIPDFHTIMDLTSHLGTHAECPYHTTTTGPASPSCPSPRSWAAASTSASTSKSPTPTSRRPIWTVPARLDEGGRRRHHRTAPTS